MIFVTVGTHEQPINRLIHEIDRLIETGVVHEDVIIQRGIGSSVPANCTSYEFLPYPEMVRNVAEARIIITHGGPGAILMPLYIGKHPIVVPRQAQYGEHVDDHQVMFTKRLEKQKKVIAVYDIELLGQKITKYDVLCLDLKTHQTEYDMVEMLTFNLENYCQAIKVRKN